MACVWPFGRKKNNKAAKVVVDRILQEQPNLKKKEVFALISRFRRIAPDEKMKPEQFRQTLGMLGLIDNDYLPQRMFSVFDQQKQGYLGIYDFVSNIGIMLRGTDQQKINISFHIANVSGSGGINLQEFIDLVMACFEMRESVGEECEPINEVVIQKLFSKLARSTDEAGKIVISLADYCRAVRCEPEFLVLLGLGQRRPNFEVLPGIKRDAAHKVRMGLIDLQAAIHRLSDPDEPVLLPAHPAEGITATPTEEDSGVVWQSTIEQQQGNVQATSPKRARAPAQLQPAADDSPTENTMNHVAQSIDHLVTVLETIENDAYRRYSHDHRPISLTDVNLDFTLNSPPSRVTSFTGLDPPSGASGPRKGFIHFHQNDFSLADVQ